MQNSSYNEYFWGKFSKLLALIGQLFVFWFEYYYSNKSKTILNFKKGLAHPVSVLKVHWWHLIASPKYEKKLHIKE